LAQLAGGNFRPFLMLVYYRLRRVNQLLKAITTILNDASPAGDASGPSTCTKRAFRHVSVILHSHATPQTTETPDRLLLPDPVPGSGPPNPTLTTAKQPPTEVPEGPLELQPPPPRALLRLQQQPDDPVWHASCCGSRTDNATGKSPPPHEFPGYGFHSPAADGQPHGAKDDPSSRSRFKSKSKYRDGVRTHSPENDTSSQRKPVCNPSSLTAARQQQTALTLQPDFSSALLGAATPAAALPCQPHPPARLATRASGAAHTAASLGVAVGRSRGVSNGLSQLEDPLPPAQRPPPLDPAHDMLPVRSTEAPSPHRLPHRKRFRHRAASPVQEPLRNQGLEDTQQVTPWRCKQQWIQQKQQHGEEEHSTIEISWEDQVVQGQVREQRLQQNGQRANHNEQHQYQQQQNKQHYPNAQQQQQQQQQQQRIHKRQ
ncbi:hypothetical protein Vretifemale_12268, partial [Volvox reticuliferus]